VSRNTLANANRVRDWRIYADLALGLIQTARKLYVNDKFGVELENTVYALDATTIDLCLSLFPWANFRKSKGAIKLHTLLDLRGKNHVVRRRPPIRLGWQVKAGPVDQLQHLSQPDLTVLMDGRNNERRRVCPPDTPPQNVDSGG